MPEESPQLSPSVMHGLLGAARSDASRALRAWEPPSIAELQRMLPNYEITGFLGRGGMGAVYQGIQQTLGRVVAIKILPLEVRDDHNDFPARFKREARAMAALTHPNIISIYEAGETAEGLLYFAMEYVEGRDVAQVLADEGPLSARQSLAIAAGVCAALEWAHSHGIIHRDIKPANVLVRPDGTVKVGDFGVAKIADGDGGAAFSGVAVGTPDFIAPELHMPGVVPDRRVDVYSAGVTLYQMLTGKLPRGRFDAPTKLVPGLSPRVDQIIDRALCTDREKRFNSASEMREAIERLRVAEARPLIARFLTDRRTLWTVTPLLAVGAMLWLSPFLVRWSKPTASTTSDAIRVPHWPHMPTDEEKKLAFTNSLDMKFVPVPETNVLFCIHETRKKDYAAYAAANPGVDGAWQQPIQYRHVPVTPADDHPVVRVNLHDAQAFCAWLSQKEGRAYRLPSDHEWSCAAGLGELEDPKALPRVKSQHQRVFAWGPEWPPRSAVANLGDETLKRIAGQEPIISGYDDGFATTAPVMSYPPNPLGIYDLAGNVWEVCSDWYDALNHDVSGRGSSFNNGDPDARKAYVVINIRNPRGADQRSENSGFRIVAEKPLAK